MLRVLRKVSEKTGVSEEECREWLKEEMNELEAEVLAIKRLLSCGTDAKKAVEPKRPKNAPKKKTQDTVVTEAQEEAIKAVEPKKPKNAPKKKAEAVASEAATELAQEVAQDEATTVVEPKKPKNAPKKKAQDTVVTEAQDEKAVEPKKPKNAPKKKAQDTVVTEAQDEKAVEPKKPKNAPKKKTEEVTALEMAVVAKEEEVEVEVEEIEYEGVKYLKSVSGVVYDIETSEEIGRWNEERKSIEVE